MAHGDKTFATTRIVSVEDIWKNHDHEAFYFAASDVIAHDDEKWLAVLEGSTFHLRLVTGDDEDGYFFTAQDPEGHVYRPVHRDMLGGDVEGARYAEDRDGEWIFAHCSPEEQTAFAAEAEAFTISQFTEQMFRATNRTALATEPVERATAFNQAQAAMDFARDAGRKAHSIVVLAVLGHYHKNPHDDHLREIALKAINDTLKAWGKNPSRTQDITRVTSAVGLARIRLTSQHDIIWRHELARSNAASGQDPIDGFEFIFTRSATMDAITGDANLPLASWPFDSLATAQTRGTHVYTDGEPLATEGLPWIIRFRRPIEEDAKTKAIKPSGDGSWEQEPAYKPSV